MFYENFKMFDKLKSCADKLKLNSDNNKYVLIRRDAKKIIFKL